MKAILACLSQQHTPVPHLLDADTVMHKNAGCRAGHEARLPLRCVYACCMLEGSDLNGDEGQSPTAV